MNICFIAIDYHQKSSGGGIATYIDTLSQELVKQGHSITILAKARSKSTQFIEVKEGNPKIYFVALGNIHYYLHKVPFLGKRISSLIREFEWSFTIAIAVRKIIKKEQIDIIESQEVGNFLLMLFFRKIPIIIRTHGAPYNINKMSGQNTYIGDELDRAIEVWSMRRARCITAPSRFKVEEIFKETGLNKSKVELIPNPISPYIVNASEKRNVPPDQAQTILYTGRIERRKGVVSLLRCVAPVILEDDNVQFVLAGGYHRSLSDREVRAIIQEEGIAEYIQLKGHFPHEKLVDLYRTASIFVIPSQYETFSISCIEAMAFGLPVVGTKGSALPELIDDGVTGLLVSPNDPQALATAIIRLLKDKDLRQRLGQAGRKRILAEFTSEKITSQTIDLYKKVLS